MRTLLAATLFVCTLSLPAQVGTSPRTLTKRIEPQLQPQRPAAGRGAPVAGTATAAPRAPLTAAQVEQQKLEQTAEEKKKLQWQVERAEKGSDPAQFALGMRYLEGKGVEKDLKKARKWLEASAKQGNAEAKKALKEHPELPAIEEKVSPAPGASPVVKP